LVSDVSVSQAFTKHETPVTKHDDIARPELVSVEPIFDGAKLSVRVDTLRRTDGSTFRYERVEYGQAVVLVPVDGEGRLLMVRQYRHAVGAELLELPAGGVDERDESPEAAALRELREEVGCRGRLTRIGGMYLAPGYSDEYQHVFAATELVDDPLAADEDEDLRIERVPLQQALRFVDQAVVRDAKSIAALLMYLRYAVNREQATENTGR
jgi:ADP-ribose pyrophosphatase